ncbi:hypothetical protein [Streptomyces sp. NPDC051079]
MGSTCSCAAQVCGGIITNPYCPDHGNTASPAMEWHPAHGIRCAALAP